MSLKLGGELELKNVELRTSTIEARQLFLNLILEMKPEVVFELLSLFNVRALSENLKNNPVDFEIIARICLMHTKFPHLFSTNWDDKGFSSDLRNTPVLAYIDFIFKNQIEFESLLEKCRAECEKEISNPFPEVINKSALREFIPNWKSLQLKKGSEWLCRELQDWAKKWNLTDDWCLDFALDCLKNFKIDHIDKITLPENFLKLENITPIWSENYEFHNGKIWLMTISNFVKQNQDYYFTLTIPNYPLFNFVWTENENRRVKEVFSVEGYYDPLNMLAEKFKLEVEQKFWFGFFEHFSSQPTSFVDNSKLLIDQIKEFGKSVKRYITKCEVLMKPFTDKTPRKDGDRHFRWFVEYQILNKNYTQIAREKSVDKSAVIQAIRDVSNLTGLTLQASSPGGRIKNTKDKKIKRRRVDRN